MTRHPAIAGRRDRRARGSAEDIVWLDSAEGLLADQGLVLEHRKRGGAQFRRTLPPAQTAWLPGQPAPLHQDPPAGWGGVTPVPLAAFTGRRSLLLLPGPVLVEPASGEPALVELDLLHGRLRAVADEEPVARLRLSGEATAVLALARTLAADIALLPGPDLAESGRALARQEAPRPRRKGAPEISAKASVEASMMGIIGHLLEVMLHQATRCAVAAGPEPVHQLRVALRRLRSALRNFRPAIRCAAVDAFDQELGALARRLGPARDWDVFLGGLGAELAQALPGDKRCGQLLKAAEARRQAAYQQLRAALDAPGFRLLILDGVALAVLLPWREVEQPAALLDLPAAEFGANLLDKRWHKLCKQGEAAETLNAEALHELRLGCKRLRYAVELFAPLWPGKPARRFLRRLSQAQEALGQANDIAVARALMSGLLTGEAVATSWAVGVAEGFALGRAGGTRTKALDAWEKLRDARVFWDAV